MTSLLSLFLDNLLPILLAAGAGYLITRWRNVDPRDLSLVTFNIFSPCLIFNILTHNQLGNGEMVKMVSFGFLVILIVGLIAWAGGRLLKLDRKMQAALLITTMFMNAGNYGLPLARFVFGEQALAYASLYFVSMVMLSYTLGVVIVSMGSMSLTKSLLNLTKIPTIYALVFALLLIETGRQLPLPLDRVIGLLGDAAIPMMLILLGIQLQRVSWRGAFKPVVLATVIKLVVSPLVAIGINLVLWDAGGGPTGRNLAIRNANSSDDDRIGDRVRYGAHFCHGRRLCRNYTECIYTDAAVGLPWRLTWVPAC